MTVIVDASVAAKWLFKENDAEKARAILEEAQAGRFSLLAPELLLAEVASSLWKRVRREGLQPADVRAHYSRFVEFCPALVRISSLTEPALSLALAHGHSVYDCLYVALALETRCDLVTADEWLHYALGSSFPQVRLLRDWRV
jgi:predicted nucleic acid-binding protein